jgi:CubicO group peptidase (beta-lactamase class C family)
MIALRVPSPETMIRQIRIALLAVFVSVATAPYTFAQDLTFSLFERYLDALRVQANIPGLSAAIVSSERVMWDTGLGYADIEHASPARADTPYHISGLTEALSSALLLEGCYETAHLSLDDRIQQRSIQAPDSTITIRDALTHRSTAGSFKYDPGRYAALTGVAETCIQKDLMPFRLVLNDRLFERLGMYDSVPAQNVDDQSADDRVQFTASQLDRFSSVLKRMALPYRVSGSGASVNTDVSKAVNAATGAVSTVDDLARFIISLDSGDFLHRETMTTMWNTEAGMPTGLGWFVQNYNGQPIYWQFGSTPGAYSSLILKVPSRSMTLILLANSDGLSEPFGLQNGDVNASIFAKVFLRLFVG